MKIYMLKMKGCNYSLMFTHKEGCHLDIKTLGIVQEEDDNIVKSSEQSLDYLKLHLKNLRRLAEKNLLSPSALTSEFIMNVESRTYPNINTRFFASLMRITKYSRTPHRQSKIILQIP